MAATGASLSGRAPVTESGVQVDSSVAHQLRAVIKALSWFYVRASMVVVGQLWPTFDGLATA
ncbi:hypothetical protein GA0070608_3559 [Micromonospora peucetia]|uniref:Uncharacterized protein n=1 Tax=Micromonospora peucetia TaxID=47871 RepID=A0A1C6VMU0_9ACTN|nr:hypothetical protein GA0070608_3559 [Micromonospora peucetia]